MPEPRWRTEIYSQHFACDRCGRSFEQLTPHSFSFNSSLGWCPVCEGLGTQTGANTAALLHDPKLTLEPRGRGALAGRRQQAVPADARGLAASHRRADRRALRAAARPAATHRAARRRRRLDQRTRRRARKKNADRPLFRFQYKGLYPALEEASRLSPACAPGSIIWSTRSSARPAAAAGCATMPRAVRLRGETIDDVCRKPLGELLRAIHRLEAERHRAKRSPANWCARCATACNSWSTSGWNTSR